MHDRKRIFIPLLIIIALTAVGIWYFLFGKDGDTSGFLKSSGTIEAVEVLVAPEQAGRVLEVTVGKGQLVGSDEILLRLNDELLQSQRQRALTALGSIHANLSTAMTGLELAQATLKAAGVNVDAATANAQIELLAARQSLEDLYDSAQVARGEAALAVSSANRAVRDAQYGLDNFTVPTNQQNYTPMDAIRVMKERLDEARQEFEPYKYKSSGDPVRDDLWEALDEAQSDYDSAVKRLEHETNLDRAQANLDKAMQDLEILQDGPNPDDVARLEARITAAEIIPEQAGAAQEQAKVGVSQAQAALEQAEKAVENAQAELDLIDVQLHKLLVSSPTSGVVLSKSVEPGEVVQPGAPVMTIGQLDSLTITVYIPEDRYGEINLGDSAQVAVDSFPGETFAASIIYISDKAEFTPRNVQTQEGRKTTVFAIELAIENPGDRLKPGMPADVCFGCK